MGKKTKALKRDGMSLATKLFFTVLFFMMGFAIMGAGIRGQEATAPIVITIGMLMNVIGIAPYFVPALYSNLVPEDAPTSQ